MPVKIATWNVNSLRVRLPQVLDWLDQAKPDILALQETKTHDDDFPKDAINAAGYNVIFSGQKTYNGMAILSRSVGTEIVVDLPGLEDPQRRVLAATFDDVRIVNLYIPNGESVASDKYLYKLNWLEKLICFLEKEISEHQRIAIMGDFNIAPEECDVHDPDMWAGKVLCSEPERSAFKRLLDLGFKDCFRLHDQPERSYTWWDYRMNAFKRNLGMRIDHILISPALVNDGVKCHIDKTPRSWERPSDHTPVFAQL